MAYGNGDPWSAARWASPSGGAPRVNLAGSQMDPRFDVPWARASPPPIPPGLTAEMFTGMEPTYTPQVDLSASWSEFNTYRMIEEARQTRSSRRPPPNPAMLTWANEQPEPVTSAGPRVSSQQQDLVSMFSATWTLRQQAEVRHTAPTTTTTPTAEDPLRAAATQAIAGALSAIPADLTMPTTVFGLPAGQCTICLHAFVIAQPQVELSCGHRFHSRCW